MHKKQNNSIILATIKHLIVAIMFIILTAVIIFVLFGSRISMAISLVNKVSIDTSNVVLKDVKLNSVTKRLESYPEYGTKYGDLRIDSLDVDLPLYYGDTLSILRNGVGHSSGSYFPGEGGTIVCMAHNTRGYLYNLSDIEIGDNIVITTTYGEFTYKVEETKIVPETQVDAVSVSHGEEMLILYTCYPTNTFGHATKRFITYSKLVDAQYN